MIQKKVGFLKTTAIGGVIFLLPLAVIGFLLGQIYSIISGLIPTAQEVLPDHFETPRGIAQLFAIAILILLILCFICGILAKRSLGRKLTLLTEKYLLILFPRYAIYRAQVTSNVGGDENKPRFTPVLVKFKDYYKLALETDRNEHGLVTVFLPGSPDPWTGQVCHVTAAQVTEFDIEFGDALSVHEKLGSNSEQFLKLLKPFGDES